MKNKIFKTASFFAALLAFVSVFLSCKTEPEPQDTTAPANVTGLSAESKDSAVILSWRDAEDSDIFGYEISYAKSSETASETEPRAAVELEKNNIYVSKGTQLFYAAGLTNETEYTFTVKTVDTSGNKSIGASIKASPSAKGKPIEITLEKPDSASTTTITATAKITSESKIERVVYKKDGDREAKVLLADKDAMEATQDPKDNTKWTFTLDATELKNESLNGIYTVAAIDYAGREETAQIPIYNFDFTGPEKFTVSVRYNESEKNFTANWSIPKDANEGKENYIVSGFKDMTVSYKKKGESEAIETNTFTSETTNFTLSLLEENQSYEFTFSAQDNFGNKRILKRYANASSDTLSAYSIGDFLFADGTVTNPYDYNYSQMGGSDNLPVAIVAAKIDNRILGLGLHISSKKLEFAMKLSIGAKDNNGNLAQIICTPKNLDGYNETTVNSSTIFSGGTDGSYNWRRICYIDKTAEENAEENYPAFWWANNYGRIYKDKLGDVTDGWFIPSIAELCYIYGNADDINKSLSRANASAGTTEGSIITDSKELPDYALSSSISSKNNYPCWYASYSKYSKELNIRTAAKNSSVAQVIVVREF